MCPIIMIDDNGEKKQIEVPEEVYEVLQEEQRDEWRRRYEQRRHLDGHSLEYIEKDLVHMEREQASQRELYDAVMSVLEEECTPVQRERFLLYYQDGYTYQEIADSQNVSQAAVIFSIQAALKKIHLKLNIF